MILECAGRLNLPYDDAEEKVAWNFAELENFFASEYEENMELIDYRINSYYNLANTRIMLMTSNGAGLETLLNDFLNALSQLPEPEQEKALEKTAGCVRLMNQKYIGYKSLEPRKRTKNDVGEAGLPMEDLSDEEKLAETEKLFAASVNRYSMEKVRTFLDTQAGGTNRIHLKDRTLRTREEVLMYAAAMLYSQNEEFPYEISLADEMIETEIAAITDITLVRKKEQL